MFDVVAERRLNECYLADETPNWTASNLTKVNPHGQHLHLAALHYHIVFSTKHREPWLTQDIEQRIGAYIAGIATRNRMKPIQIGGVDDHVHVLLGASANFAPAKIAQLIKGGASPSIHTAFAKLQDFAWQDGYGAFTVSKSGLPNVKDYIMNQRDHHQRQSFKDEFLGLVKCHEVEYNERYFWD